MIRMACLVVCATVLVGALTLSGCPLLRPGEAADPDGPSIVSLHPAPGAVQSEVQEIRVEFDAQVSRTNLAGFGWGYMSAPHIRGNALVWEYGPGVPEGTWQVLLVGEVSFASGRTVPLREAWDFLLRPVLGPCAVDLGLAAPVEVTQSTEERYGVVVADRALVRKDPAPDSEVVWEATAGVVLAVLGERAGYVEVGPLGRPGPSRFTSRQADAPYPQPPAAGWLPADVLWILRAPWDERVTYTVGCLPPTVAVASAGDQWAYQFLLASAPTGEAFDAALAYVSASRISSGLTRFLSADSSCPALTGEDVEFLCAQVRAWYDTELARFSEEPWPQSLASVRQALLDYGAACREGNLALLRLLDRSSRDAAQATLGSIIRSVGLAVPGAGADRYEWGDALSAAWARMYEEIRAGLIERMAPSLAPWYGWEGD